MNKIWFKRKTYGWGWTPATWEGWTILAAWAIAIAITAWIVSAKSASAEDTLINFYPVLFLLTAALIIVCAVKGETPRWQWGSDSAKNEEKKQQQK